MDIIYYSSSFKSQYGEITEKLRLFDFNFLFAYTVDNHINAGNQVLKFVFLESWW